MKGRFPALLALVVVLGVVALSWLENGKRAERERALAEQRDAEFSAAQDAAPDPSDSADPEEDPDATSEPVDAPEDPAPASAGFTTLPDGSPVPALPKGTPTRIKLGLAIFRYKGAQAPPDASRSREAALELATQAAKAGQEEFERAVKQGDQGSDSNVGWMERGILEPAVEYAVFRLDKGQVSEPIDTPRGFWVAKRIR